ncbi:hydrogenase iron-sulfur subunit [Methanomassiliicoccus luminyensis]|uniref:hydrogenase iron-sulfur subunit n=1 Tax=Methanomassiliicoccus luminyensis TaxID=1080712 RepID=UPI00036A5F7C|nr:hydrogenase iron-sulfur subunit [Methanomassiliicoccus luminyensis]
MSAHASAQAAPSAPAEEGRFEPKIIAFCCNWCSYAGADLAGVSRLQMPTNFLVIRAMCSARVDPEHVLRAFAKGADGVLVLGCHPADCHYIGGNYRTRRRIALLKMLLEQYGIDPERLHLEWVSASEGVRFQATIKEFTEKVREMGPNPLKEAEAESEKTRAEAHH